MRGGGVDMSNLSDRIKQRKMGMDASAGTVTENLDQPIADTVESGFENSHSFTRLHDSKDVADDFDRDIVIKRYLTKSAFNDVLSELINYSATLPSPDRPTSNDVTIRGDNKLDTLSGLLLLLVNKADYYDIVLFDDYFFAWNKHTKVLYNALLNVSRQHRSRQEIADLGKLLMEYIKALTKSECKFCALLGVVSKLLLYDYLESASVISSVAYKELYKNIMMK